MVKILGVFIPIAFFICATLCVYFIMRFKYETIAKLGGPIPPSPHSKQSWKKVGIVVIGFALGLIVTGFTFLWGIIQQSNWNGLFIVGLISLFVGLSLVVADKIDNNEDKNNG